MNKGNLLTEIRKINFEVSKHSPAILIFLGITGFTSTVVMACKATPKAHDILEDLHEQQAELEEVNSKPMQVIKEVKAVTPVYLPSVLMGSISVACLLGSYSISSKRTAALATAYSISERTLHEYQKKVVETIGEHKEEKIRDEIAKDHIRNNPPERNDIYVTNSGDTLCFDTISGRYFRSNIDTIRKAESILNRRLIAEMFISLNEFYDEIDMPHIPIGDELGWNVDELIELMFSSQLTANNEPCLVIDYGICPRYDFRNLM